MATILAGPRISDHLTCQRSQPKRVIKFAIGEKPSIGGHHGTAKLEHQAAVKIEPNSIRCRFTRRVRHHRLDAIKNKLLIAISESRKSRRNSVHYPVNAGLIHPIHEVAALRREGDPFRW